MLKTLSTVACLLTATALHAEPIVHWGGSDAIVSSNVNLTVGKNAQSLSLDTLTSPTVGAGYYDPTNPANAGATPEFYAAAYGTTQTPDGVVNNVRLWRLNDGTPDNVLIQPDRGTGASTTETLIEHIYLWTKEYFLAGEGADASVALTSLTATTSRNTGTPRDRFVIRLGESDFYISDENPNYVKADLTFSITDPTSATWYSYDPLSDFTQIGAEAWLTATDFDNLTATGVFISNTVGGQYNNSTLLTFDAEGTVVVPEPAALALGALGGLLLLPRRRSNG